MKSISISITTKSPLLLSQGPPAHNLIKTLDFIPGNTIRGLLARQYLSNGGQAGDSDFASLFLFGETRFGFARINGCQTIPLSARSCKYNDGFKEDQGHGVIDVLLSDKERRCEEQECNMPVDYFEGFWNPAICRKQRVRKRLITRTAINPVLGNASMGQLYSQQVIEEEQVFRGIIEVPEDLAGALGRLFPSDYFIARIGTGRSRGQGWVEVRREALSLPSWGTAKERFKRFKDRVLVVTLLSDAIFHDKYLRDCTAPDISHLKSMDMNKGTALLEVAALMGLDAGGIMAIGDSANDIEMLRAAGLGVAVGNANPALNSIADMVTSGQYGAGVVEALEYASKSSLWSD